MNNNGRLFVIAAPSGAGKTSLVNALVASSDNIVISVSYTTREPRPSDEDGVDYHFTNDAVFEKMISGGEFLEHAQVYGYYYGTSQRWVTEKLATGVDVILEIDWQGARQICEAFSAAVSVFILPPSQQALQERLQHRGQDNAEVIQRRMSQAQEEISHYSEFDYVIVNDDFERALADFSAIVRSEQLVCHVQQTRCAQLLAELLENR